MHMRANQETNDPASWARASYSEHPVDVLEPEPDLPNVYREVALKHLSVSYITDSFMSQQKNGVVGWIVVSIVMSYPSTQGRTLTSIATELGVTKQALSRKCTHFSRMLGLEPTLGMKSIAARIKYTTCHYQT
jgi:hypothetical protein